jgi:carbon storage regulator CsrA
MLVISRKQNETLVIGDSITITVVDIRGDKVRLGIVSPVHVPIHRKEVQDAIYPPPVPAVRARSPQELAFVQAVLETPDDEGIRLIFADWLGEQGDPYGEFIRVQCQLAKLPAGDESREELQRQEQALWAEHGRRWREYLPAVLRSARFERGFVESAELSVAEFLDNAEAILAAAPLRRLRVRAPQLWDGYVGGGVPALAASPYLARLAELDLSGMGLGDGDAAQVAGSAHAAGLQVLVLRRNPITEPGAQMLRARFGGRVRL